MRMSGEHEANCDSGFCNEKVALMVELLHIKDIKCRDSAIERQLYFDFIDYELDHFNRFLKSTIAR